MKKHHKNLANNQTNTMINTKTFKKCYVKFDTLKSGSYMKLKF